LVEGAFEGGDLAFECHDFGFVLFGFEFFELLVFVIELFFDFGVVFLCPEKLAFILFESTSVIVDLSLHGL
jgi:hypothetical protein